MAVSIFLYAKRIPRGARFLFFGTGFACIRGSVASQKHHKVDNQS